MGDVILINNRVDSVGMTVSDCIPEVKARIASGDLRPDTQAVLLLLNPRKDDVGKDVELFSVGFFNYGLKPSDLLAVLETAKIQVLCDLGYTRGPHEA